MNEKQFRQLAVEVAMSANRVAAGLDALGLPAPTGVRNVLDYVDYGVAVGEEKGKAAGALLDEEFRRLGIPLNNDTLRAYTFGSLVAMALYREPL